MALQPQTIRRAPPPPGEDGTSKQLTSQDHLDNDDAGTGTAEDGARQSTELAPLRQGQEREPQQRSKPEPIKQSPHDDVRANIAARFRRAEPADERPFNGDMTDNENTMGEVGRDPDDDDDLEREAMRRASLAAQGLDPDAIGTDFNPDTGEDDGQQQLRTEQQPVKKKVKVRGRELELTDDEILAAAQKTLAGDTYLEEARQLLDEAKKIRQTRAGQDHSTTGDQTGEEGLNAPDLDDGNTPLPTFKSVVEKIQFGDPEEAAQLLEQLVDNTSKKRANEGQLQRAFDQDLSRSQKALKAFSDANPDLAKDEIAAMAIEANMYKLYSEDMKALGLDESQIPKDKTARANWHRFYRVNGYEVRPTSELLNAAKDNFLKWRGGQQGQSGQPAPRKAQPRVEVNLNRENRDTRRAAIPNQPSRTSVPRRDASAPAQKTGSDVVAGMRKARGQV